MPANVIIKWEVDFGDYCDVLPDDRRLLGHDSNLQNPTQALLVDVKALKDEFKHVSFITRGPHYANNFVRKELAEDSNVSYFDRGDGEDAADCLHFERKVATQHNLNSKLYALWNLEPPGKETAKLAVDGWLWELKYVYKSWSHATDHYDGSMHGYLEYGKAHPELGNPWLPADVYHNFSTW